MSHYTGISIMILKIGTKQRNMEAKSTYLVREEQTGNRITVGKNDLAVHIVPPLEHCFERGRSREIEH
jgi:hypothetical protein